jgi:hypothetical protein
MMYQVTGLFLYLISFTNPGSFVANRDGRYLASNIDSRKLVNGVTRFMINTRPKLCNAYK